MPPPPHQRTFTASGTFFQSPVAASQAFFPVGTTSRGRSSCRLHSQFMGVSGIVPGKIMEWPGTVRPAALWIALLQHYSQSRWLLSYWPLPKNPSWNTPPRPFLLAVPIDSQWTLFCSTGIVPVEIMEQPGTVRPVALWIALLQCYSQSRWPHGSWPFHDFAWYNSWNSRKPWMEPAVWTTPGGHSNRRQNAYQRQCE